MALEEVGVSLVAEGADAFEKTLGDINGVFESFGNIVVEVAGAAATALGEFFSDSFAGALEAEQTIARLGQVIESTGGAAGITVKEAEALADEFKNLAGGSDDAIISIIDMGLRMGTISEDEMPAFIQTTLDLGTVMGDTAKASQVLARAQEDPVGTLGALRRAGILVSEEMETQIKAMVKAGDTAGAYSLLMTRVGEATQGAAETMADTTAGQWAIFQETIADAGETIVGAFLPALMSIAGPILDTLVPAISTLAEGLGLAFELFLSGEEDIAGAADALAEFANDVIPGSGELIRGFGETLQGVWDFIVLNMPLIQSTFESVWGAVQSVLTTVGDFVTVTLMPAIASIWEQTGIQLPTAQETFEMVMGAITVAVQGVATFINETLVPAVTEVVNWVVEHWPEIQATAEQVWGAILSVIQTQVDHFNNDVFPVLSTLWTWMQETLPPAIQTLSDFWTGTLQPAITQVSDWMTGTLFPILDTAKTWLSDTLTTSLQTLSDYWTDTLLPAITGVWEWMKDPLFPFLESISNLLSAVLGVAVSGLATVWEETLLPAITKIYNFFNDNIKPIIDDTSTAISETLQPALTGISEFINATFVVALNNITAGFDGITLALQTATTWFNNIAAAITGVPDPPDVYNPGSPTPFETGLWGIVEALEAVTKKTVDMDMVVGGLEGQRISPPISPMAIGAQNSYTDQRSVTNNLNVTTPKPMTSVIGEFATMQTLYGAGI